MFVGESICKKNFENREKVWMTLMNCRKYLVKDKYFSKKCVVRKMDK